MAWKEFTQCDDPKEAYRIERENLETIRNSSDVQYQRNIMLARASLLRGNTYSLFFDAASCDLGQYLSDPDTFIPKSVGNIESFLYRFNGLVSALNFLHTKLIARDTKENLCFAHLDLRPANILVFNKGIFNTAPGGVETEIWKIGNFGVSRIKKIRSPARTIFKWLLPGGPEDQFSPATRSRHEGTFYAPEIRHGISKKATEVQPASDIWSLGCILSLVISFLDEGPESIRQFQIQRRLSKSTKDPFYVKKRGGFILNPAVVAWLSILEERIKANRQFVVGLVVNETISLLRKDLLVIKADKRANSQEVKDAFQEILGRFHNRGKKNRGNNLMLQRVIDRFKNKSSNTKPPKVSDTTPTSNLTKVVDLPGKEYPATESSMSTRYTMSLDRRPSAWKTDGEVYSLPYEFDLEDDLDPPENAVTIPEPLKAIERRDETVITEEENSLINREQVIKQIMAVDEFLEKRRIARKSFRDELNRMSETSTTISPTTPHSSTTASPSFQTTPTFTDSPVMNSRPNAYHRTTMMETIGEQRPLISLKDDPWTNSSPVEAGGDRRMVENERYEAWRDSEPLIFTVRSTSNTVFPPDTPPDSIGRQSDSKDNWSTIGARTRKVPCFVEGEGDGAEVVGQKLVSDPGLVLAGKSHNQKNLTPATSVQSLDYVFAFNQELRRRDNGYNGPLGYGGFPLDTPSPFDNKTQLSMIEKGATKDQVTISIASNPATSDRDMPTSLKEPVGLGLAPENKVDAAPEENCDKSESQGIVEISEVEEFEEKCKMSVNDNELGRDDEAESCDPPAGEASNRDAESNLQGSIRSLDLEALPTRQITAGEPSVSEQLLS